MAKQKTLEAERQNQMRRKFEGKNGAATPGSGMQGQAASVRRPTATDDQQSNGVKASPAEDAGNSPTWDANST